MLNVAMVQGRLPKKFSDFTLSSKSMMLIFHRVGLGCCRQYLSWTSLDAGAVLYAVRSVIEGLHILLDML